MNSLNSYYKILLTLAARVNLSPLSPTQMLRHNLRMCNSLITFLDLSLISLLSFLAGAAALGAAATGYKKTHTCQHVHFLGYKQLF